MKEFRIENNKIYSNNGLCERTDIFEIVDKIPVSFFVWNIGENMGSDEYTSRPRLETRRQRKF